MMTLPVKDSHGLAKVVKVGCTVQKDTATHVELVGEYDGIAFSVKMPIKTVTQAWRCQT